MRRFIQRWLDPWRSQPVLVHSSMEPDAATAHLRGGLGRGFWARFVADGYHVNGRADPDGIRLWLRRPGGARWALLFRGRLTPDPNGGSVLTGSIGWPPQTRISMAASLAFVSGLLLWRVWITIVAMLPGGWSVESTLPGLVGAVALWVVVALSPLVGRDRERRDDQDLRHWLRHRLNEAEPRVG